MSNTSNNRQSKQALPEGWREVRLGDNVITNDATYSKNDKWNSLYYLDTGNITENKIELVQKLIVGKDKIPSRAKRKVKNGDIVYSTVRPIQKHYGILKNSTENFLVSTGFTTIRAKTTDINTNFIYWFLSNPIIIEQLQLIAEHSTSTYPSIRPLDIENLKINLPPLPEQQAIANILGSLDDKIEINRQINETLEEMAQALFKSWFVDFDPVYAKAILNTTTQSSLASLPEGSAHKKWSVERAKNYLATLPQEVSELFPSEFEHHKKMGWIPKGWGAKKFGDLAQIVGGGTPSTKEQKYFSKDGIAWLSPKDLSNHEWRYISKGAIDITNIGLEKSSAKLMPKSSILFSSRAPIGYIAISENEICTNQGFKSLVPHENYYTEFLYQSLKQNTKAFRSIATGSTFTEISGNTLKNFTVITSTENIIKMLELKLKENNLKLLLLKQQNQTLTQLRDTLLPKLISGKIRIKDVEKIY